MDSQTDRPERQVKAGLLTVRCREQDDALLLQLDGELDLATVPALEAELDAALAGSGAVVIDMSGLTFIDSTGIALLVAALARDGAAERLRFVPSAAPGVARVLALTGVDKRLPCVDADQAPGATASA